MFTLFSPGRTHWDHPYTNVRHQIANTLATLLCLDIPVVGLGQDLNVGAGFPTKKMFLDEVIPQLNLNYHNPEFCREDTPTSGTGWLSRGGILESRASKEISIPLH